MQTSTTGNLFGHNIITNFSSGPHRSAAFTPGTRNPYNTPLLHQHFQPLKRNPLVKQLLHTENKYLEKHPHRAHSKYFLCSGNPSRIFPRRISIPLRDRIAVKHLNRSYKSTGKNVSLSHLRDLINHSFKSSV